MYDPVEDFVKVFTKILAIFAGIVVVLTMISALFKLHPRETVALGADVLRASLSSVLAR